VTSYVDELTKRLWASYEPAPVPAPAPEKKEQEKPAEPSWMAEIHKSHPPEISEPVEEKPIEPPPRSWPKAAQQRWPELPSWAREIILTRHDQTEKELRRLQNKMAVHLREETERLKSESEKHNEITQSVDSVQALPHGGQAQPARAPMESHLRFGRQKKRRHVGAREQKLAAEKEERRSW
jgi:hypothetical protein